MNYSINKEVLFYIKKGNSNTMAQRDCNRTHKEGEKSNCDDEPIENKTEILSSKTDKSNNKTDSNSTTGSRKKLKMTFDLLVKHIQECVKKEMKKNCKRKPKKYISSSSESSDSDTSSSDSDDSDSNNSDSESKYRRRKKHRRDSRRKSRKRKQKRKSKHSKSNPPKKVIPLTLHHLVLLKSN